MFKFNVGKRARLERFPHDPVGEEVLAFNLVKGFCWFVSINCCWPPFFLLCSFKLSDAQSRKSLFQFSRRIILFE